MPLIASTLPLLFRVQEEAFVQEPSDLCRDAAVHTRHSPASLVAALDANNPSTATTKNDPVIPTGMVYVGLIVSLQQSKAVLAKFFSDCLDGTPGIIHPSDCVCGCGPGQTAARVEGLCACSSPRPVLSCTA
jgi:hypothetical protein